MITASASGPEQILEGLKGVGYLCSREMALALHLARLLQKPLLVEGPPGVGKTELARASATLLGLPLIRLQCYEGIDESRALYEWKYGKQLLYTQLLRDSLGQIMGDATTLAAGMERLRDFNDAFHSEAFLEPRPLLSALQSAHGCVLLVDEIDKADEEFEAFLLEILSDYQVSIPELGTVKASVPPLVFLTSNDSRELGDALRRRCLHLHIPYPSAALENAIVASRVPEAHAALRNTLVAFVQAVRDLPLRKPPAISETIEWARALVLLQAHHLDPGLVRDTLNVLLKHRADIVQTEADLSRLLAGIKA
jgi:MoxR-like ATPase